MHAQRRDFVCRPLLILLSVIDFCTSDIHTVSNRHALLGCSYVIIGLMVDYLRCLARPFSLTFARPFFLTIGRLSSMSCYRSSVLARWKRRLARPFSPRRGVGKADQLTEARVLLSLCPMSGVWTSGRPSRECLHWNIRNIFLSAMDFVRLGLPPLATALSHGWSAVRPSSLLPIVAQARRPTPC